MRGPYFGGHRQITRVGALELVETLHEVAENHELEWLAHIFGELGDELEIEGRHILGLVDHDDVFARNMDAGGHGGLHDVADTGVRVGGAVVVFDGETVVCVDVEIVQSELLCFLFDFTTQHGVVCELDDFLPGHCLGERKYRGGFA